MTEPYYDKVSADRRYYVETMPSKYGPPGATYERRTVEVKCCGQWLHCDAFTNTCRCGADYNGSGQHLAPRSQWGIETGEHWTDIIRIR